MRISTPASRAATWRCWLTPPKITVVRSPAAFASGVSAAPIWLASSRVGARISPRGWFGRAWRPVKLAAIGMLKARVLPDPVRPRPSTSRPFSVSPRVAAWMGNAVSRPCFARARTSALGTPRSAKDGAVSGRGAGFCGAALRALELRGAGSWGLELRGTEPRRSDGRAGAGVMKYLHGAEGPGGGVGERAAGPDALP